MTADLFRTCTLHLIAALALTGAAHGQLINIDFDHEAGTQAPTPASYAAAGTSGVWNQILNATYAPVDLVDKAGATTGVTLTLSPGLNGGAEIINPAFVGDDALLMNDIIFDFAGSATFTFDGLADGNYEVLTYALAPDAKAAFVTGVDVSGSSNGLQNVGGSSWPGNHATGVSYARHNAQVTGGTLVITALRIQGFMSINGIQIEQGTSAGLAYCFGDGSGAPCPCSATGGTGEGCMNTSGTGATLSGSGTPSTASDSLVLSVTGAPASKPGLFFQGSNAISNPIGDGLLCTSVSMRYAVNPTDASGNTSQSGFGMNAAPGMTVNYQYWFRDPANSCGGGFNFSNGWVTTWE